jgi:hypothetical protein
MSVEEEGFDMSRLESSQPSEPEPAPEPEVVSEPDEAEVVDEVVEEEVEQTELPAETQSDQKHNELIDKEVQKLQQLRATYEREISKLGEAPTERQVERVEKAKTKLDKYLESSDVDPYQGVTDIASEVMADRGRVEQLLQQFDADRRASEEREIRREAEIAEMRFAMDYPELKGQYGQLAQKANEALLDQLGTEVNELSPQAYVKLVNHQFVRLAKEAASQAKPKEPKASIKDTAKKPKAAKIINTKNGTKADTPQSSEAIGEDLIAKLHQKAFGA